MVTAMAAATPGMPEKQPVSNMRKQWILKLTSVSLAGVLAAAMAGQALAIDWHSSRTQSEVEVTESTTTTATGSTITVTTTPAADATGTVQQVADATTPVIQVTPVSATLAANAAVDATNPSATANQLAATATGSGLNYAANGQLNNLYNQITTAESTELLETTAPAAAAEFEATVGAPASDYTHIALYDVAALVSAKAAIAESGSAQMAISVPGVADSTQSWWLLAGTVTTTLAPCRCAW